MHDQQIDITPWLTFCFPHPSPPFFFTVLQEQNTATDYPQHIQLLHWTYFKLIPTLNAS